MVGARVITTVESARHHDRDPQWQAEDEDETLNSRGDHVAHGDAGLEQNLGCDEGDAQTDNVGDDQEPVEKPVSASARAS